MARTPNPYMHFQSPEDFRREIDDAFKHSLVSCERNSAPVAFPPVEAFLDNSDYVIRLDLPGIDPNEIEVTVTEDVVTVRGAREHHDNQEQRDFIHCELAHGGFERSVVIPRGIRTEDISASYKHGVVELRMPAPKESRKRKVPVQFETGKRGIPDRI